MEAFPGDYTSGKAVCGGGGMPDVEKTLTTTHHLQWGPTFKPAPTLGFSESDPCPTPTQTHLARGTRSPCLNQPEIQAPALFQQLQSGKCCWQPLLSGKHSRRALCPAIPRSLPCASSAGLPALLAPHPSWHASAAQEPPDPAPTAQERPCPPLKLTCRGGAAGTTAHLRSGEGQGAPRPAQQPAERSRPASVQEAVPTRLMQP